VGTPPEVGSDLKRIRRIDYGRVSFPHLLCELLILDAMTSRSISGISLMPEEPEADPRALDRIRDAFVEHLVEDCGTELLEAKRKATDICRRELSISRSENQNEFLAVQLGRERVGLLWKAERVVSGRRTWHLLYVETVPQHRKKGIAEAAMKELIRLAQEADVTAITLNVSPRNLAALALYRKLGFLPQSGGFSLSLDQPGR
jgi:ribosomal protein S18 acetylase RimI-like enzyme